MTIHITFTSLSCQTCQAKIHCKQCADTLANALLQQHRITHADIDMGQQHMTIDSTLSADDIEQYLEEHGILLEQIMETDGASQNTGCFSPS